MAPKKKNNKKANDDWEAELGETIAPVTPPADDKAPEEADADNEFPAGGLMATMKKRKDKKKKKGPAQDEDEELDGANTPAAEEEPEVDLSTKVAEEADMDDEFALPDKKSKKGGKKAPEPAPEPAAGDDDAEEGGRVMTKKEKEKAKKAREQQRKKEQVCYIVEAIEFKSGY